MKFLCVDCDEAMNLERTGGPDNGSMTVLFACPKCGRKVAMLTNSMETQMVRSLGVKIGAGGGSGPAPMETIRESLVSGLGDRKDDSTITISEPTEAGDKPSGGKCPFTGMVNEAFGEAEAVDAELIWTAEALERLERIPSYVRPMVEKGIVEYAREIGANEIDADVMSAAKGRFGM